MLPRALKYFTIPVLIAVGVALVRDTFYQGQDFEVFWRVAQAVLRGEPAYDLARDGAMVFKYPPWVLPVFFPFALLPLSVAKWAWGGIELLCLAGIALWLFRQGVRPGVLFFSFLSFWGIWAVHALDGQAMLLFLAIALAAFSARRPGRGFLIFWALSAKVFTLFAGLAVFRRFSLRGVLGTVVAVCVLSLPAVLVTPGDSGISKSSELLRSWSQTAGSGGSHFDGEKIRGRDNQGFPALVLRIARIPSKDTGWDIWIWLALAVSGGLILKRVFKEKRFEEYEIFAVWLACSAAIHPLAWFHSFVLAYPLAAVALNHAWSSKQVASKILAVAGLVSVAWITRNTLGPLGNWLELASIKAWGVVLLSASLWSFRRDSNQSSKQIRVASLA